MNEPLGLDHAAKRGVRAEADNLVAPACHTKRRRHAMQSDRPEPVAVGEPQEAELGRADAGGIL